MATYIEFEKPLAEIESRIEELQAIANANDLETSVELTRLKQKAQDRLADLYANLDPWQKTLVARHVDRPKFKDFVASQTTEFVAFSGDRRFGEDSAIMGGLARFRGRPVMILGHEKGRTTEERLKHNFGMARPEGYRKAIRLMDMAEHFRLPVIALVDTAGAYPGIGAEERGQAEAIARCTERCLTLRTPMVSVIVGEGGSGGAVAIAAGDKVFMLEHAIYSVIAPESAVTILWKDKDAPKGAVSAAPNPAKVKEIATALRITAKDLLAFDVIDAIIPEPLGGAHRDQEAAMKRISDVVDEALSDLIPRSPDDLLKARAERFYRIGRTLEKPH